MSRYWRNMSPPNPQAYRPAIATMSLGKAGLHDLKKKLEAAASRGFQGIELFWDDLEAHAQQLAGTSEAEVEGEIVDAPDEKQQGEKKNRLPVDDVIILEAARAVRTICDRLELTVVSLQPFRNYEGIIDPAHHAARVREFQLWLSVAAVVGADVIGVPATMTTDSEAYTHEPDVLARDLAELATLAHLFGVRVAYENLCFAAHVRSWSAAWDVVSRAGEEDTMCFLPDTFNICGEAFADPTVPGGEQPDARMSLRKSLDGLIASVPASRIPLLQVADAELMTSPLAADHPWMTEMMVGGGKGSPHPKMAWSRNARLFPFEEAGYLPIVDVVEALVHAGWSGWVSLEVFSRSTAVSGDATIHDHVDRAWKSWERLADAMGWEVRPRWVAAAVDGSSRRMGQPVRRPLPACQTAISQTDA